MKAQDHNNEAWSEGRAMRPRPKDVAYQECEVDDAEAAPRVPYEQLSRLLTEGSFARLSAATPAGDLTADLLRSTGFQDPILVRPCESIAATHEKLGMRAPAGLDAAVIAAEAGPDLLVPTIDVETQQSGPRMTLQQWADYFAHPPDSMPSGRPRRRRPLLNVVSLSLAGTPLEDEVQAPLAVRAVDLVDAVWPPTEEPRPEVLLYALMSPAGAYTDFHMDFGGSSVWYQVISGRKTFLLVPPTPPNLAAFESWASSQKQAGRFFGHEVEGALLAELGPGDTMLIPGSWPHAVATLEDSVVVGGNFLHALDLRRAVETWDMETRLGVGQAARFPLFRQLMWHTAVHYHVLLCGGAAAPVDDSAASHAAGHDRRPAVSAWEMSGLAAVLSLLRRSLRMVARFGPSVCPASIADPAGMLQELDTAISKRLPGGLSLQVSDYFLDLDPLDDNFLLAEDIMPEGFLLKGDEGVLGMGGDMAQEAAAAYRHEYHLLDFGTASPQQPRLVNGPHETHTLSEEDAEIGEERPGKLEDSGSDWSGAKGDDGDAHRVRKRQRASKSKAQGRPGEPGKGARLRRLVKRRPAAVGNGVATRTAPDEALLVKLGSPRPRLVHSGDRMAQQIAAYASLDDDDVRPSSAQNGQRQRSRGPHDKEPPRSAEEEAQSKAHAAVWHLRARLQQQLALQGRVAGGQVRLKDGGKRLRAAVAAAAAELAAALRALEATGKAEAPWAPSAFQGPTLSFIDAEGRTQGPFMLEHLRLLAEEDVVTSDTIVLHAAHGPSLLRAVLAVPAAQGCANSVQHASQEGGDPANHAASSGSPESLEQGNGWGNRSSARSHRDNPNAGAERAQSGASAGFSGRSSANGWHGGSQHRRERPPGSPRRRGRRSPSPARDRAAAAEMARARRTAEVAARAAHARSREAEQQDEAAETWARLRHSRASAAVQSLQQEVLEAEAAAEGCWTFMGKDGREHGPFTRTELLSLHRSGQLAACTMVHDEDEGTSVQLSALLPAKAAAAQSSRGYPSHFRTTEDMRKVPPGSFLAATPVPEQVNMELESFHEPISPDMEPLTDDEENDGGAKTRSSRYVTSESWSGSLRDPGSRPGSGGGNSGGWGPPGGGSPGPPPAPPDSPPPPPPHRGSSSHIEHVQGGEQSMRTRHCTSVSPKKQGMLLASRQREPPHHPSSAEAASSPAAAYSVSLSGQQRRADPAGQQRGACGREHRHTVTADPVAAKSEQACFRQPGQIQAGNGHMHPGSGHQGPADWGQGVPAGQISTHMQQPMPERQPHPQMLPQNHSTHSYQHMPTQRERSKHPQHWQPPQPQLLHPGGNQADTGALGSMLQGILENVRTAGSAVRQMGHPPVRLGPPSDQPTGPDSFSGAHLHPQQIFTGPAPSYPLQAAPPEPSGLLSGTVGGPDQPSHGQEWQGHMYPGQPTQQMLPPFGQSGQLQLGSGPPNGPAGQPCFGQLPAEPTPVWTHPGNPQIQHPGTSQHARAQQSQQPQLQHQSEVRRVPLGQTGPFQGAVWHPQAQQGPVVQPMQGGSFKGDQGVSGSVHANAPVHQPVGVHYVSEQLPPVRHPWDVQLQQPGAPHAQQVVHHPATVTQQSAYPWG